MGVRGLILVGLFRTDSVKKRFCLSLKMATNFFELATTLKNLEANWLSEKKLNHCITVLSST